MGESSAWDGTPAWGSIYLDTKKFYDSIIIPLLIDIPLKLEFPPVELYLNCAIYLAPRAIRAAGAFAPPIIPGNVIVPGCNNANNGAWAFLCEVLDRAHSRVPHALPR
eukprot:5463391-Pyramimonas_sp.AAC.1